MMPYRKVTTIEQIWYMLKWGLKNGFWWQWREKGENDPDYFGGAARRAAPLDPAGKSCKARRSVMPYRKPGTLETCWYILKQGIRDLFRRDPYEPVYTKQPDGATLVTWRPKEKRRKRK